MASKNSVKHNYWLMKSEPSEYSIDDLRRQKVGMWDGVRNYQVRNMFRDEMKKGDSALFYHSSTDEVGVVGEMTIHSDAYPDPTQFAKQHDHYDALSNNSDPRWLCVDVLFVRKFPKIVTLATMRGDKQLKDVRILEKGSRLSVVPLTRREYERIVSLGTK